MLKLSSEGVIIVFAHRDVSFRGVTGVSSGMNVLALGATGRTGRWVLEYALGTSAGVKPS
jgi:hypothetical protein